MSKNPERSTVAVLKAYHIYVIAEAARVWPRPVRLGLLPKLLQSSIQIGLRLLIHSRRTYPFCNDTLAFSQPLMVVPVWHCCVQSESSIRLNVGSMFDCPSSGFRQANPAMHLSCHPSTSVVHLLLIAAR
jgi:hypothetical protein